MRYIILTALISLTFNTLAAEPVSHVEETLALTSNLANGKKVYELCGTCHMDNGWGKSNGSFPVLAGQHKSVIIKQLKDIQSKNRSNPTMYPFADAKTIGGIQAISDVAAYISELPVPTNHGIGNGDNLKHGQSLYKEHCSACHGENGEGNAEALFPKIQAQHYNYLARQLKWIRDGLRKNGNPAMLAVIKDMSDADLEALADAVSRLKPMGK